MAASYRYRNACLILISTSVLLDIVAASPAEVSRIQSSPLVARLDSEVPPGVLNCETQRSDDYYGLGVRIGVYFAWLQSWVANVCVPSEIGTALDTNTIFFAAILLAMVRCTISGLLLQVDGLILMHMAGGFLFSVTSIWGYRTCVYDVYGPKAGIRKFGGYGTHFRLLICMAVSTYGLYYWAWGITGHLKGNTETPGCDVVYTFMFSKVRATGGIRIFYIIMCISCMLYFGALGLIAFVALPERIRRIVKAHQDGPHESTWTRHKFMTGLTQKQLRYIFYFCRIGNLLFILYSMFLIEFSLNFNNMTGVLGSNGHIGFPSQLVPTIVGAFGFVRVVWVRYNQWKSESEEYNPPVHEKGSTKHRTIWHPIASDFRQIYTAKSNVSMQNTRADGELDPRMEGEPVWLRLLITWAPWLGVLPRFTSRSTGSEHGGSEHHTEKDPESPRLMGTWSSSESTPHIGSFEHRNTWESDDTISSTRMMLPETPKNISHFGTI